MQSWLGGVVVAFSLVALVATSTSVLGMAGWEYTGACLCEPVVMFLAVSTNMGEIGNSSLRNRAGGSLVDHSTNLEVTMASGSEFVFWETDGVAGDWCKGDTKEGEHHAQVGLELSHDRLVGRRCSLTEVEARCGCG